MILSDCSQRMYVPLSLALASPLCIPQPGTAVRQGVQALQELMVDVRPHCQLLAEMVAALDTLTPPTTR